MINTRFHKLSTGCLLACFAGFAWAAAAQTTNEPGWESYFRLHKVTADDDWTRHFRVGAAVGLNISASFNEHGLFNLSGNNVANGIYDDGYVREDQTGNAGGYTSYWGYNNASQYNAAAQTLSMHSTTSYSTTGGSKDDGSPFLGFDMAYGDNLWYWRHIRIGWELGFDLLPITITDNQPMSAMVSQSIYTFNTGGIVVPSAPYQGGPGGQGPLLPGTPALSPGQTFSAGTVTGTRKLDVMLYSVKLGPSFYWDWSDHLGMSLGAGPAVGVVSVDYNYDEIVTTASSSAHNVGGFGTTDVVFGGYVSAMLMYHFQDNGRNADIFVGAQYMPMGDATISDSGREGCLNLGGQAYVCIGMNWPF
jgi:hypothetical protein